MDDQNEIIARIKTSPEGTRIVYHRGLLAEDKGACDYEKKTYMQKGLAFFSGQIYEAYLDGFCALVQKRLDKNVFEYIAIVLPSEGRLERSLRNRQLHEGFFKSTV